MQLGMIGVGRMGGNMVRRLMRAGHECVVYDLDAAAVRALAAEGAQGAADLDDLVARLRPPRAVWLMVPAPAVEGTVETVRRLLARGDVLIDGGNSHYRDAPRRAASLRRSGIHYVDVGTSGGIWGLEQGFCLMIGGEAEVVARLEPLFEALAPAAGGPDAAGRGFLHCGPSGAGHFVKMVHNGIEYGLMAAYAEGFNLLRRANAALGPDAERYDFDLAAIANLWRRGSVVRSWLLDLVARALDEDPGLERFRGAVGDSGEGRWTVQTAVDAAVPVPVLSAALYARFSSRGESDFADKLLSALREQFGGHAEPPTDRPGDG